MLLHYLVKCKLSKLEQIVQKLRQSLTMLKLYTCSIDFIIKFVQNNFLTCIRAYRCVCLSLIGRRVFLYFSRTAHRAHNALWNLTYICRVIFYCHRIGSCFIVTFVKCPWSIFYLRHFKFNFFTLHYNTVRFREIKQPQPQSGGIHYLWHHQ